MEFINLLQSICVMQYKRQLVDRQGISFQEIEICMPVASDSFLNEHGACLNLSIMFWSFSPWIKLFSAGRDFFPLPQDGKRQLGLVQEKLELISHFT